MDNKVLIETSARHIHVSQEHLELLFGKGYTLTNKKALSQPGQFACEEKVTLKGPKGEMKLTILGPVRNATQAEISLTDARSIGLKAPIRESGDITSSAGATVVGPCGSVNIAEGVIAAKRHIHITESEAAALSLKNGEIVSVKVTGTGRAATFSDVVVRVSDKFAFAMHIDTDESNAAALSGEVYGEIIKEN